jgi:hypothetical protein
MAYTQTEVTEALLAIVKNLIECGEGSEQDFLALVGKKGLLNAALTKGNQAKAITRVTRAEGEEVVVRWKLMQPDCYRGKGPEVILEELFAIEPGSKQVFKDYQPMTCTLVLERPSLGGDPGEEQGSLVWPRVAVNGHDAVWVRARYFRGWLAAGSRFANCGDKTQQAIKNKYIWFDDALLEEVPLESLRLVAGKPGTGLNAAEALPVGTRIPVHLEYPSIVPPEEIIAALRAAARMVGFSPSKHHDGWGRGRIEFE